MAVAASSSDLAAVPVDVSTKPCAEAPASRAGCANWRIATAFAFSTSVRQQRGLGIFRQILETSELNPSAAPQHARPRLDSTPTRPPEPRVPAAVPPSGAENVEPCLLCPPHPSPRTLRRSDLAIPAGRLHHSTPPLKGRVGASLVFTADLPRCQSRFHKVFATERQRTFATRRTRKQTQTVRCTPDIGRNLLTHAWQWPSPEHAIRR